ncbi:MAG: tetratricopeptide repeat protein [Planctomycetaceae bacterium]|jgi:tetratricopeptide (TPR) repeat protein|nr:tetratricopeptide repeat protein [Planctomycetaceae bacterium]
MARYVEEEKDDEEVVIRKRRRPVKKPVVNEDDDDAPIRRNQNDKTQEPDDDDEDDDDNLLPSTGFVFLDIALDYWDDYIYWTKDHFIAGIIVGVLGFLLFFIPALLLTLYIYNYINRPTLQKALDAYDFGAYGEAGKFAEIVLKYTSNKDDQTRAGALFVLGASACSIAEMNSGRPYESPKKNYYLAAAKYLSDCRELGYYPGRTAEAAFMLGKSFYLAGEFAKACEPLNAALENNSPNKKMLYWYLANANLLTPTANIENANKYINLFKAEPTTTDEEIFEADLLRSLIQVYNNKPDTAEQILKTVPQFDQYEIMKTFIKGQIAFLHANTLRKKSLIPETKKEQITPPTYKPTENLLDKNSKLKNKKNYNYTNTKKSYPKGVIAKTPELNHNDKNSIYQRIIYLAQIEPNNNTTPITPNSTPFDSTPFDAMPPNSTPFDAIPPNSNLPDANLPDSNLPDSNLPDSSSSDTDSGAAVLSPDAIITLPPEKSPDKDSESETPLLPESMLPDGGFFPPSEIDLDGNLLTTDPYSSDAKKYKELAQQKYLEAIELFHKVRINDLFDLKWLRTAELLEGRCNEEIGRITEAKNRYRQISEIFPTTDEAAAADFFYAEIERGDGHFAEALAIYDRAFDILRKNPDYACHWFTRKEIANKTRDILQWLMRRRDYRNGINFLSLVEGIILPSDIAKFNGEFYENWGKELHRQSLTEKEQQPVGGERESGYIEKFRRAGDAFSELARYQFGEQTYDAQIWRSAENYRLGKQNKRAIEAYKTYLRVNKNDHQAEALLYIGEMYVNLAMIDEAITNLEEALTKFPRDALTSRIRYILSHAYNEKRNVEKAKQLLIANLIEGIYDPSSIVYSDSVYLLAKLSYEHGDTTNAIVYLEDALKIHPTAPQAAEAHYFIARSYFMRAEETLKMMKEAANVKEVEDQIQNNAQNDRALALEHIQMAERLLTRRRDERELMESEAIMLRNAMFGAGKIMMTLKQYEKAIATFNMVAIRYREPASLDALLQIALAYRALKKPDEAIFALNRAEMLLQELEESGTIPKNTNWSEKIQLQKNIINKK